MNFLAHLFLAGDDEGLRLGAMLGDFLRGALESLPVPGGVRRGILLHRHVDQFVDRLPAVTNLREQFTPPFRRFSGIIIDLAFDHELARTWEKYSPVTLEQFDRDVRDMLTRHQVLIPDGLRAFMRYADRRGLFKAYQDEAEVLFSLERLGTRLGRPNPLHRVGEIWMEIRPAISLTFSVVFPQVRQSVSDWLQFQHDG